VIAVLFAIAKLWIQPSCPIDDEWIKKVIHEDSKMVARRRKQKPSLL
jgi:hypothetical protein